MTADRTPRETLEAAPESPAAQTPDLNLSAGEVATLAAVIDAGRAKNTLANYRSAWSAWQAWADERGARALPAHPAHVAAYLTHRAAQGAKMPTVRLAAAAIAAAHRESNLDNPCQSALVKATVRGLARQAAQAGRAGQKQAAALTKEALAAIRATACNRRKGADGTHGVGCARCAPRPGRHRPVQRHVGRRPAPLRGLVPVVGRRGEGRGRQRPPDHPPQQDGQGRRGRRRGHHGGGHGGPRGHARRRRQTRIGCSG